MSQAAPAITRSPAEVVRLTPVSQAPNGICYASAGEVAVNSFDLERMVAAVPTKIAGALDLPLAQFFAEDSLGREMNTQKLTDEELRFLTQIRRYSSNLNDSDRKLLLAMVKKFAATAVR